MFYYIFSTKELETYFALLYFWTFAKCVNFFWEIILLCIEEEAEQADTELSEPETGNDQEEAGGGESESDDRQTVLDSSQENPSNCDSVKKNKCLLAAAASTWRAAADMGDSSNPKWRRVAVRAVQIQETKINGSAGKTKYFFTKICKKFVKLNNL